MELGIDLKMIFGIDFEWILALIYHQHHQHHHHHYHLFLKGRWAYCPSWWEHILLAQGRRHILPARNGAHLTPVGVERFLPPGSGTHLTTLGVGTLLPMGRRASYFAGNSAHLAFQRASHIKTPMGWRPSYSQEVVRISVFRGVLQLTR